MLQKRLFVILSAIFICGALFPKHTAGQPRPRKKVIEYGWDVPYPDFVEQNIQEMEKRPFEGIIFRTNNFLTLYAANKAGMNWFNDEHWENIEDNLRLFSLAVKTGRCVGVCFDPEPYGTDPWVYPGSYKDKSFDEVGEQVRKRGRQFIRALEANMPKLRVLSFFQFGLYGDIVDEPDPKIRQNRLLKRWMVLLPSFYIGILEGASSTTILIDGNESAYYYESPDSFYRAYHLIRQRAQAFVPEDLRQKYNAQVQAGMALYIDQTLARRTQETTSHFLSPQEQLRFFEHNAYYALSATDEYVWCYSERMNWWLPPEKVEQDRVLPAGVEEALIIARQKHEQGKPLGFDIKEMIEKAHDKRQKAKGKN